MEDIQDTEFNLSDDEEDEIELVVQGKTISINEKLLLKHSLYFRKVFSDFDPDQETMVLKNSKLPGEDDIPLEVQEAPLTKISYVTMSTIVDFLYTGELKINDENMRHLLVAADLLAIRSLELHISKYIKSSLSTNNCIRRYLMVWALSRTKLIRLIENFICHQFEKIRQGSAMYKRLNAEQMKQILSSDILNVHYEEQVYDAVMDWTLMDPEARRKEMYMLFQEIQWPLIRTTKYYTDTLQDPFVMHDNVCADIMEKAQKYINSSYEEKLNHWKIHKKPSRWPKLLATLSYAEKLIECYDFEEQNCFVLTEKPGCVFGAAMCQSNGKLYTLGGVQSKTVDQYDIENNTWVSHFPSLRHLRVAHGVVADDNNIYVTGGSAKANANFGPGQYEMEHIQLDKDNNVIEDWKICGSMKEARSFLGSAALNGLIYAVGGCLNEEYSTTEVYDPATGKFTEAANTLSKRDTCGLACLDGYLYAVGGYDNGKHKYLNSVEKYDPDTDSWEHVEPMNVPRRSPGVVNFRGRLYVIAGMGEKSDLTSIEMYCPVAQQWTCIKTQLQTVNGWTSVSLIDKPLRLMGNAREYARKKSAGNNMILTGGAGFESEPWEFEKSERRESVWSTDSGYAASSTSSVNVTPTEKKELQWNESDNVRTQQRMKQRKEFNVV